MYPLVHHLTPRRLCTGIARFHHAHGGKLAACRNRSTTHSIIAYSSMSQNSGAPLGPQEFRTLQKLIKTGRSGTNVLRIPRIWFRKSRYMESTREIVAAHHKFFHGHTGRDRRSRKPDSDPGPPVQLQETFGTRNTRPSGEAGLSV